MVSFKLSVFALLALRVVGVFADADADAGAVSLSRPPLHSQINPSLHDH